MKSTQIRDYPGGHIHLIGIGGSSMSGLAEMLIDKGYQAEYGARPLRRAIERYLEDPLAEELLRGYFRDGEPIRARMDNNSVIFLPDETEKIAPPESEEKPAQKRTRRKKKDE